MIFKIVLQQSTTILGLRGYVRYEGAGSEESKLRRREPVSDTTQIRMINLQVMAEKAIAADKAAGTYGENLASDDKYYLWQSEFQTRPMGMENQPEAYASLLRSSIPDANTIRVMFNDWSFNKNGSLDPQFERFLSAATQQGFQLVFTYADGEAQRLGETGNLDVEGMRAGLAGSVHDRMIGSWGKMLDWLDGHGDVKSAVYALETVNEPASYSRAEDMSGGSGEFVRLYGDHMAEVAELIDARSDARIMVGGWAYSSLFDVLAETTASDGGTSVLDQIRAAVGDDLVWSAHLYPHWAAGAGPGQEIDGMADLIRQRYGAIGDDDLVITETNLSHHASNMAFWMARTYEVFAEAGIGLGWFPAAETGDSSLVTITNGKRVNFLHPDIYAEAMNGFLLGQSDPDRAGNERVVATLLPGTVYEEDGSIIAVDGLGYGTGHGGNDTLVGIGRALNMLYGGTGDDSLTGTAGRDYLFGQGDNDRLVAGAGHDVLMGGDGDDFLHGGAGNDVLTGGRGADHFVLDGGGEDLVTDFRGDLGDRITIGGREWTAAQLMASGKLVDHDGDGISDDLVLDWANGRAVLLNLRRPDGIVQGTEGADNIGVGYVDVEGDTLTWEGKPVQGLGGNDTINGSISNDVIDGGAGNDVLAGRSGNDLLTGGDGADSAVGHDGDDTLNGEAGNDSLFGETGNDLIRGGTGQDSILGGAGMDTLSGDAGNDTIDGGNDNDLISGGTENDSLLGGAGNDTLSGDSGADVISGGFGRDEIYGGAGADYLDGNGDDDTIDGGAGNDTLAGGYGSDLLTGGAGNDTYIVETVGDRVVEAANGGTDRVQTSIAWTLGTNLENLVLAGSGNLNGTGNALANNLLGNAGKNMLNGAAGNDTLAGGGGNDTLSGGAGKDVLDGGAGADRLIGEQGADRLTGAQGADVFVFRALSDSTAAATGRDTITDFSMAQGDRIDLSAIDARTDLAGNQAFSFIGAAAFTGKAGELATRSVAAGTQVLADVNGDRKADFAILLDDPVTLNANSFLL